MPQPAPVHLAIRISPRAFTVAIGRLSERAIAFGNDPEDATNGRTDDPLGTAGRAYFRDPDGHLYELVVAYQRLPRVSAGFRPARRGELPAGNEEELAAATCSFRLYI